MKKPDKYIPIGECKHGYLYHICCRNLLIGVYNEKTQGFVGIRTKFGHEFLFTEYHWDTGAPFGTVQPVAILEECPIADLSEYVPGQGPQTLKSETPGPVDQDGPPVRTWNSLQLNQVLFDWLRSKEKQYADVTNGKVSLANTDL